VNYISQISNEEKILTFSRYFLIGVFGLILILYFDPYYERTQDSYLYGIASIQTSDGSYEYSNDFLKNSGLKEFVPFQWNKTINNEAVPSLTSPGIVVIGSIIFKIFGEYGLFYFGPLTTIGLFLIAEKTIRHIFDNKIAFVSLIFLITAEMISYVGRVFLTDNLFTVFFLLGCFYLIKSFKTKNINNILYSSIFFTVSSSIRLSGAIVFPIEIIIIFYFIYDNRDKNKKYFENNKLKITIKKLKYIFNIFWRLLLPWFLLIMLIFSYNYYYFENYYAISSDGTPVDRGFLDPNRVEVQDRFQNIVQYGNAILPSPINRVNEMIDNYDERIDEYYPFFGSLFKALPIELISNISLGIITIIIIVCSVLISFFQKNKRLEIGIFTLMIIGFFTIFSSDYIVDRFMIHLLPLFFTIGSFLIFSIIRCGSFTTPWKQTIFKIFKIGIIISLTILISVSIYFSEAIQILKIEGTEISNPIDKARYPLDKEGLNENSLVIGALSSKILDYDLIPFDPMYKHPRKGEFESKFISENSIELINQKMNDGHSFYVFKETQFQHDKPFFRYLIENYEFVLKDHSNSFCKLEVNKNNDQKSDEICIYD
jgi:hypothetical protein